MSSVLRRVEHRQTASLAREEARLVAPWAALAVALLVMRGWIIWLAEKAVPEGVGALKWAPLLHSEDLLVVAASFTAAWTAHSRCRRPGGRRALRLLCWVLASVGTLYAAVNVEVFRYLRSPLTYRLWRLSDNLKGVQASVEAALEPERALALWIIPAAALATALAVLLVGSRAGQLRRFAPRIGVAVLLWAGSGLVVLLAVGLDHELYANPHVELFRSWLTEQDPFVAGTYAAADLDEFDPATRLDPPSCSTTPGSWSGKNVLLLVLESVGAKYMSLYSPEYMTTPHLCRLAEQYGLVFDRYYAHAPSTSAAIASMFCSVLPRHGWRAIPGKYPKLSIASIADVVRTAGYRTGFLHSGDLSFDDEGEFLRNHGFQDTWDFRTLRAHRFANRSRPALRGGRGQVPDASLLTAAEHWIDQNRHQPFFLVLWTIQTHHPYVTDRRERLAQDRDLNRYLLALKDADRLLLDLWNLLDSKGLLDNTVLVITADHGEAFWQHGHIAHGQTLFEEEIRIPLVFLSRSIEQPGRVGGTYRQIDLAPTLAALLGSPLVPEWQGKPICPCHPEERPVYLFTCYNHYLFGVLHKNRKYIYDATTGRRLTFDLDHDPHERIPSTASTPFATTAHRKLAAWLHFQNPFLDAHAAPMR